MADPTEKERTHDQILALQDLVCRDIAFFKRQQWQATYYGLLLYGTLVAVPKLIGPKCPLWAYWTLGGFAALVLAAGFFIVRELETALSKRRDLLAMGRRGFTSEALMAYGLGEPNDALKLSSEKVSFKHLFTAAFAFGFVLCALVLYLERTNA